MKNKKLLIAGILAIAIGLFFFYKNKKRKEQEAKEDSIAKNGGVIATDAEIKSNSYSEADPMVVNQPTVLTASSAESDKHILVASLDNVGIQ